MIIKTSQNAAPDTVQRGRPRINFEQMPARFPHGTFERMDKVLKPSETRTDMIREVVESAITSRERIATRKAEAQAAKLAAEAEAKKAERKAKRDAAKSRKGAAAIAAE